MVPKRHRPGRTGSVSMNSQSCWAAHRRRSRPPPLVCDRSAISNAAPTTSATTATRNHTDEGMPTARSVAPIPPVTAQRHVTRPRESRESASLRRESARSHCAKEPRRTARASGLRRVADLRRPGLPGDHREGAADDQAAGAALGQSGPGRPGRCRRRGSRRRAARLASWSPIADCTSRRSGRAPYIGSKPLIASHSRAASVTSQREPAVGQPARPARRAGCRRCRSAPRSTARGRPRCRRAG